MQQLVKDLLAYGQLTLVEIVSERVDLDLQVAIVLKELEGEMKSRQAKVVVESSLPEVQGSISQIGQGLTNLLTNALKFIPPGANPHVRIYSESIGSRLRL
ncbi:hypothetical protein [Pedosphaera parvula]|uniref:histidine kinase n=1 Tax=Pedosphaera parvula (strain Ellin514) TaxID=320771 RepID=B9XFA8_PEDPL|nr:hypothetical protein [Pedosphaera parvula]EEF61606.1 two-component hybrid sensor and regulator [Pedosphaera parvula Ellin514]